MPKKPFYIAAYDNGGTKVRAVVASSDGKIVSKAEGSVEHATGKTLPEIIGNCLQESIDQTKTEKKSIKISAIAGSQAGVIDRDNGNVTLASNVRDGKDIQMDSYLTKRFKVPFWLENDADAAAYCILKKDPQAKGMKKIIYISMGTGIGGGIIINGEIYSGVGGGVEPGHMIVEPNGKECGCGKKGCWERYCSGSGIEKTANENDMIANIIRAAAGIEGPLKAEHVFKAKREGCGIAEDIINKVGEYNAIVVSNLINLLRPEALFIGEVVAQSNPEILQMLQERVPRLLLPGVKETKIFQTKLTNPGLDGAVYLAIDRYRKRQT